MRWKHILIVSLFFCVLTGSLLYYGLPIILYRPRKDPIPLGAYIVPWMQPNPSIETIGTTPSPWNIETVMTGALQLDITFRITTRTETRVVPSTVYLGHDLDYLYVGGKFRGMFTNPASDPEVTLPNYLEIFFDVANDGKLTFPESGSSTQMIVHNDKWQASGWLRDRVWMDYEKQFKRACWIFADEYYNNYLRRAQPAIATAEGTAEYDNSTGTVTMIFSRRLRLPETADSNALQIRPGERWTMGFLLELGFATWYGDFTNFVDGWPQKTYPYLSNDSSWWPKLVMDLSNPPAEYPGGPGSPLANLETPYYQNLFCLETMPAHTIDFMTAHYGTKYGRNEK
jgi:hypothetical protein